MKLANWPSETLRHFKTLSDNSLRRDIDCFVHSYVHSRHSKSSVIADTLDCPLVDLRLIVELSDGKTYQFQRGPQVSLPDEIFAFAVADFWRPAKQLQSMAFEKLAYDAGSPGRIFKLDEDSLVGRLETISRTTNGAFVYDETAGRKQVYKHRETEPITIMRRYYKQNISRRRLRRIG